MSAQNNTQSTGAGQGVGDAIKGIFNAGHGAGETIRGTINDTLDGLGEGIASNGKSTGSDSERLNDLHSSNHAPQNHASTVEQGKQELAQGINSLSNAGGQTERS